MDSVVTVAAGGLVQEIQVFSTVCCAGEIRCIAVAGEEPLAKSKVVIVG